MALIEFQDLPNTTTPLTASNLNNNFNELGQVATTSTKGQMSASDKTKLDRIGMTSLFSGNINSKTTTTLSGNNVQWYDLVLVLGTTNAYDHRRITNVFIANQLSSNSRYHTIFYSPEYNDINVKLYDHTLDTSQCTNIGTNGCRITNVYGIKF